MVQTHEYHQNEQPKNQKPNKKSALGQMVNTTKPPKPINFLIELEDVFECETRQMPLSSQKKSHVEYLTADQVYKKLNGEVLQFKQDCHAILSEMNPLKTEIITQV